MDEDVFFPEDNNQIPPSNDAPISTFLWINYIVWPIVGIIALFLYWNGSEGWLDRGYWHQLQQAANTTYPFNNAESPAMK